MKILSWAAPLVVAACFLGSGYSPIYSHDGPLQAADAVQSALQAEARGELALRSAYLHDAEARPDQLHHSHWLQGRLLYDGQWLGYDELIGKEKSAILDQYHERRHGSPASATALAELAVWCEQNGLPDQARAHWHAVLRLDPNHEAAHVGIGLVQEGGKWVSPSKAKEQAALEKRIDEALDSQRARLTQLKRAVEGRRLSVAQAAEELARSSDIAHLPAWEKYVSAGSVDGAFAVVQALDKLSAPEASLALARHALFHPATKVQKAAIAALKTRDEQSYFPQLVGALRNPWQGEASAQYDPVAQRVITRISARSEMQEANDMHVLEDIHDLSGVGGGSARHAAQASIKNLERFKHEANDAITAHNRQIVSLLQALTNEKRTKPQEWWQWWDQRSETRLPGNKQTEAQYLTRTNLPSGDAPAPFVFTRSEVYVPPAPRCECLVAGTEILTSKGPCAVEKLQVGDLVLARHPTTGETGFKPVIRTTRRPAEPLVKIDFDGHSIRASGGHPFWVSGQGWVKARDLQADMYLHGLSEPARIVAVQGNERMQETFNLIVDDFHSYFVQAGNVRVLSHDNTNREPVRTTVPGLVQPRREK